MLADIAVKEIPFIQGELSSVASSLNLYENSTEKNTFSAFERAQRKRILNLEKNKILNNSLLTSKQQQLEIVLGHIEKDKELLDSGYLSSREYELNKREYQKEVIEIQENALVLGQIDDEIQNLISTIEMGKYNLMLVEMENYRNLLNSLESLKKIYFKIKEEKEIIAPVSGTVFFSDRLNFSRVIQVGNEILTIKPDQNIHESIARIVTGPESLGRIQMNDRVMITLDAYPIQHYGVIYAKIGNKREISDDNRYIFDLNMMNGLTTSYQKEISPLAEMKGMGDILINRTNIYEVIKSQILATRTRMISGES